MADHRAGAGLQTLFAIFLGLMLTAFIGVGVFTFYPNPNRQFQDRIQKLDRDEASIRNSRPHDSLTSGDRDRIQQITDERNKLYDQDRGATEGWCARTSIILVSLATVVMAISLTGAATLPVINNGLLMGGVFTMIYGVGWVIISGTSAARFVVMTIALIITLGLGYLRFVKRRGVAGPAASAPISTAELTDLEQRVRALEDRMTQAANAFRQ